MTENKKHSGEFEWIGKIRDRFAALVPEGTEGIGDDCAIVPVGGGRSLVVTTDMLVENVHFVLEKIEPEDLGYKSLAVNLSDVAAMGAKPLGSFLSVGLPSALSEEWRDRFLVGYQELSERFGIPLLGGDTTRSEKLVINVTAIGKGGDTHIKRRSGAKPGDIICVTGNLGDSGAGLRLLQGKSTFGEEEQKLVKAHYRPKPYVEEGTWLGMNQAVHAMMDVSDGIASDLIHILKASGVAARIELSSLPVSRGLEEICSRYGWSPEELAVSSGEDYVLLLTVEEGQFSELNRLYHQRFGEALTTIGHIEEGNPSVTWLREGRTVDLEWRGYSHF